MEKNTSAGVKLSLSLDEVSFLKHALTDDRPYADRISFSFLIRLMQLKADRNESHLVLDEIDFLEGRSPRTTTKKECQFHHAPLYPLWHKHYCAPRHMFRNISERWGLRHEGNKDLTRMLQRIADTVGSKPGEWQAKLSHELVIQGYRDRSEESRMTGDWIIFAKYDGQNYYLDLATHEEGQDGPRLYQKLRLGCQAEFPFIFEQLTVDG